MLRHAFYSLRREYGLLLEIAYCYRAVSGF